MRGMLYGTTVEGGANYDGVVFSTTTSGKEQVVYNFGGQSGDGQRPMAPLTKYNGKLYGTTFAGGAYGLGTVFEVTTSGTERVLHSFSGGTDGAYPRAGLSRLMGFCMAPRAAAMPAALMARFSQYRRKDATSAQPLTAYVTAGAPQLEVHPAAVSQHLNLCNRLDFPRRRGPTVGFAK